MSKNLQLLHLVTPEMARDHELVRLRSQGKAKLAALAERLWIALHRKRSGETTSRRSP